MRAVAAAIGRTASTISRELKRNALDSGRYAAHVADGAYMARRQRTGASLSFTPSRKRRVDRRRMSGCD